MDGITLRSMKHPKGPFFRGLWFRLFPPKISEDSLEVIEVEIQDMKPRKPLIGCNL